MMLRKIYKTLLFFAANFIFLIAGIGAHILTIADERRRARTQAVLTMSWSRTMCSVLGIHVVKSGGRGKAGGFTVCNHISYADVFVMGSLRPSAILSKHEVKGWPLVGWLASLGGTVFVNRGSKRAAIEAMQEIEQKIDNDIAVVIFPEGTTSDGRSIKEFKSTFFNVPAGRNIPVTPASIRYSPDILDAVAWYGGMKLVPHFWNLIGFRSIEVQVHFNPSVLQPAEGIPAVEARKRLCTLARESVAAGFEARRHR